MPDIRNYFKVDSYSNNVIKLESNIIRVYTDGSAINNGKKNCYGGIGIFFGDNDNRNVSKKLNTTKISNNVAELLACLEAIKIITSNLDFNKLDNIIICTDSEYMIKSVTIWSNLWEKNNWNRNVKGKNKPIKNLELIKEIRNYHTKYNIVFKHIKSHKEAPKNTNTLEYRDWYGNDMADKLAKLGSLN